MAYDAQIRHDATLHQFSVPDLPIDRCDVCGEIFFTNRTHDHLYSVLRTRLGLLQPEEIRDALTNLGVTQAEFAARIGVTPENVADWSEGLVVQSRAHDNLMRLFLAFPIVREALDAKNQARIPFGAPQATAIEAARQPT